VCSSDLKTDIELLYAYAPYVIVAFAAILVARLISVYPIIALTRMLGERLPDSWNKVLAFAGLRGAVSVALVLSLLKAITRRQSLRWYLA
jgi:CPA1 family monovalent cation:H+ antiporter